MTTDLARTATVSYSNNFGATLNGAITNVNDGNDLTGVSESQAWLGGQPGPFDRHFQADLGAACYVASMELLAGAGASGFDGFGFIFYIAYSDDGLTWTDATGISASSVLGEGPSWQTWGLRYTFGTDGRPHRYWRVGGRHDAPFGWTSGLGYMTWRVTGMVAAALASSIPPGLIVEYLTHDPTTFGPLATSGVITEAVKVGWSWYSRYPSNAFFTLRADNIHNARLLPLRTHIRVWYHNPTTGYTALVFSGKLVEPDANGNDVVWTAWSYLSELSLSRTGYRTMYQNKLIGTEIASVEWGLAKNAVYSPLAFVATGTIENPLGTDGVTAIKTDARFGVIDVPRLLLMFDLTEIGRANTANNVTMGITRTPPHTFFFLKNAGSTITSRRLTYPGNIHAYRYVPGYGALRNDLATIGTSTDGGAVEIVKTDEANASTYGRRQDVFQIKTLAGEVGGATELDAQNAITARAVKEAVKLSRMLQLDLRPFAFEPFDGWDIEDVVRVEIPQESIDATYRIVGARGVHDENGYHPQLFVSLPTYV